jgi:hypothetical protein
LQGDETMTESESDRYALRIFSCAFPGHEETPDAETAERTRAFREMTLRSLERKKDGKTIFDLE